MDNPEGALSFFQDDADKTVAGLRRLTLLPFSRKHHPPPSFALINLSEVLGSWVQRDQGTVDKEVGRQAW